MPIAKVFHNPKITPTETAPMRIWGKYEEPTWVLLHPEALLPQIYL